MNFECHSECPGFPNYLCPANYVMYVPLILKEGLYISRVPSTLYVKLCTPVNWTRHSRDSLCSFRGGVKKGGSFGRCPPQSSLWFWNKILAKIGDLLLGSATGHWDRDCQSCFSFCCWRHQSQIQVNNFSTAQYSTVEYSTVHQGISQYCTIQ